MRASSPFGAADQWGRPAPAPVTSLWSDAAPQVLAAHNLICHLHSTLTQNCKLQVGAVALLCRQIRPAWSRIVPLAMPDHNCLLGAGDVAGSISAAASADARAAAAADAVGPHDGCAAATAAASSFQPQVTPAAAGGVPALRVVAVAVGCAADACCSECGRGGFAVAGTAASAAAAAAVGCGASRPAATAAAAA